MSFRPLAHLSMAASFVLLPSIASARQEGDTRPRPDSGAPETSAPKDDVYSARFRESLVITAARPDPRIDRRTEAVFRATLFSRDDQVFHSLAAGINAGQHEGGGKSLEIRRFGFNLDHGGVSGGLKVLVDNVQQNQGTQGHGQGYLGSLKGLSPELVEEVEIVNGPFSAQYGDFSGLGVVHVRLKESLPDPLTVCLQAGSFSSSRGFVAASRRSDSSEGFVAYERSRSDGPFQSPLRYARDNVTANLTRHVGPSRAFGLRLNTGRNDFFSSGQIPLDEVAAGRLDRFGFIDPDNGGRVRSGVVSAYYRDIRPSGDVLKLDAFVGRSLFDLYSNFTFFLVSERDGDEIQQHDSRLQQGLDVQYLHANRILGRSGTVVVGGNVHANQIRVGLFPAVSRAPIGVATLAHANAWNAALYGEQLVDLTDRLRLETGVRLDAFRFQLDHLVTGVRSPAAWAVPLQPKLNLTWRASGDLRLHANYGRGIASQDARGIARNPSGRRISTTDFYQLGLSRDGTRVGASADLFWIDRSNEQVYIPDDGSLEFKGPSRAYGFEIKASARLTQALAVTGGITQVLDAYYRGTSPRVIVDSAPRTVADAAIMLSEARRLSGSLRYRHAGSYRLAGEAPTIRAAGLDVLDLALQLRLGSKVAVNLAIDNLAGKSYYETQNYFESRVRPNEPALSRIHATPGFGRTVSVGVTLTPLSRRH